MQKEINFDKCPICSSSFKLWREKKNVNGIFKIVRCNQCGFAFVNPRPTLESLDDFYTTSGGHASGAEELLNKINSAIDAIEEEKDYPNSTKDAKKIVGNIKKFLPERFSDIRFLDIGSGYGFFSKEALSQKFKVTAIELSPKERIITEELTGLQPVALSFENFEDNPGSYSAILMSQILEHAFDIKLWIKKTHNLLVQDGILAIALPNFNSFFRRLLQENDPYIIPPAHLNFFTPANLSALLEKQGFKVVRIEEITRIDARVIIKRFPFLNFFGKKIVTVSLYVIFNIFNFLKMGMMVQLYARKK